MHGGESPAQSGWGAARWLLLPLTPLLTPVCAAWLAFLLVLLPVAYLFSELGRPWRAWRLRVRMRKAGRACDWADVEAEVASRAGTLIIDTPCPGWSGVDVWWIRESVSKLAQAEGITIPRYTPELIDIEELKARVANPIFDRWCLSRFLDSASGTARLVQITLSRRSAEQVKERVGRLLTRFPTLESVVTQSGLAHHADMFT